MATTTESEKKKTVVPKEMRERLLRGQEAPVETPEEKTKREADEKAVKDKAEADAKEKADQAAKEKADEEKKKKEKERKTDLPPIPAAGAPAPITEARVAEIVRAEHKPVEVTQPKLNEDDQKDLELAEFAARQHGDRYADLPGKVTAWVAKRDDFLTAKAKELGGRETPEFRDFVRGDDYRRFAGENAPAYQRGDAKKIYEEYIEDRGAKKALREIRPEMDALEKRQRQIEQAPVIEQTVAAGVKIMLEDDAAAPDEALVEFLKNPAGFVQSNEVEGQIVVRHATFFKEVMNETLRITSGLADPKQLEKNPTENQKWIDGFIQRKEAEIEAKFPNGAPTASGAIIVTTAQLERLKRANVPNLANYRTMLPAEIVGAIAVEGRLEIKRQLSLERQKLERSGFQRVKKVEIPKEGEKSTPSAAAGSPMAGAAPAPGAGAGTPAKAEPYWKQYVNGKA